MTGRPEGASRRLALGGLLALAAAAGALGLTRRMARTAEGSLSAPLRRGPIIEAVYGIGTVTAGRSYQVRLGVITTVTKLYVREGDPVERGGKLAIFGDVLYTAPFTGVVTYLPVKEGENAFPQAPVLSLVDLTDRYLVVSLEERAALRVRAGQKARLSFESVRDTSYDGVVRSVYSNAGDFLVRIDAYGLPAQILPGMTADAAIAVRENPSALLAPAAALSGGQVFRSRGSGRPEPLQVKTGIVDGPWVEVVSGDLREGDRLVLPKAGP